MIDRMQQIGNNIRRQRIAKNLTQEYVAGKLDVSSSAYSNIERGKVDLTLTRIEELANVLEISIDDLMREVEPINITAPVSNAVIGNNQHNIIGVSEQVMENLNATLVGISKLLELVITKIDNPAKE